jgi:hypothetical protein
VLDWLFGKRSLRTDHVPAFHYSASLVLEWDDDCEMWTSPLPELSHGARIFIGPRDGTEPPQPESCDLITEARDRILSLNDAAVAYLVKERSEFVRAVYKHELSATSFYPTGIEVFEHENAPGHYSLTFDPLFDPGAIWRVRFSHHQPVGCGFDD